MPRQSATAVAQLAVKVPAVTLDFWLTKVLATTLGETAGDAVSMSMDLGYLTSSAIFAGLFIASVWVQIQAKAFHPVIYWVTIITTTTLGTTVADFADRSLGIGYAGGSSLLLLLLLASLAAWYLTLGSVAVDSVNSAKSEIFYWVTIMFSQTLGTALGDWVADTEGLGFAASSIIFSSILAALALAYQFTRISHTLLFWAAFILTRPLGAVVGDLLDKPFDDGGLEISRYWASAALLVAMVAMQIIFRQKQPSRVA